MDSSSSSNCIAFCLISSRRAYKLQVMRKNSTIIAIQQNQLAIDPIVMQENKKLLPFLEMEGWCWENLLWSLETPDFEIEAMSKYFLSLQLISSNMRDKIVKAYTEQVSVKDYVN